MVYLEAPSGVRVAIRIAGIQPGYLPWLGYFDQMLCVDAFIVADELQFTTSGWTHRNRVRGPRGPQWLTLPARPRRGARIADIVLDRTVPWLKKHLRRLRHFYRPSPHAHAIVDALEVAVDPNAERMVDASLATIRFLADSLGITTPILLSSQLGLEARYAERFPEQPGPSHRIVAYMDALGADELLEGATGVSYLDCELFARHGKRVEFHSYEHPVYPQLYDPFVSHLSAIDLLLNVGTEDARRILRAARS